MFAWVALFAAGWQLHAQGKKLPPKKTNTADSTARARQRVIDSTRKARQQSLDSMKAARMHTSDSMRLARKKVTDSLTAIRNYRQSKKYQDSVAKSRQAKVNQLRNMQKHRLDSMRAARKQVTDSIVAIRTHTMDSIHAVQKRRTDSLMVIKKYKESKRYRDSVALFRQARMDSMRVARKRFNDSAVAARKKVADSAIAVRKHYTDSLTASRKLYTDSLKAVRKVKSDSLAKIKEVKEKQQKVRDKMREDKAKLALELKIQKKHQAWSNEKMLKKKWSLPRQAVQNTFTRYNYYFNSDKKMDEALLNMQRAKRENYEELMELFPFDPDRDSTMLSADMDSIIHKASVGIQIHDPRSKWGDDLYLLMGEAYYYKGSYDNALTCFRYIVSLKDKYKKKKTTSTRSASAKKGKQEPSIAEAEDKSMLDFLKHKTAHNRALLWMSRVYVQKRKMDDAESVQDLLAADPNFPEELKGRLAVEKAFLNLKAHNYKNAITQLSAVTDDKSIENWLRMRAAYINGQINQQEGNYLAAADNFRKVIDLQPKIDMDFYARKNLAYSLMYAGGDQKEAIASLKRMLNDGKYTPYYEQVYFVLGRLSANSGNTADAVTYLQKSISTPKSTKKQKAVSFASLGNLYYRTGNYEAAKTAYDSATAYSSHAAEDPDVKTAITRSRVLTEITGPARIIHTEDSLLVLSALNEKDQRAAVRRYIRKLEQQRADSIFRAENATAGMGNTEAASDNNFAAWYFSNPVLMQQGVNDFKRKWGNRPLADNWRRSSAAGFGNNTNAVVNNTNNAAGAGNDTDLDENGLPTEESLLAAIPNTPEQQDLSRQRIQKAYIEMGNTYIRQLGDYPGGLHTLDTLDKRFANHGHKAQALYLRYLAALHSNELDKAQQYSNELLQQYGSTEYASLVRPTESGDQAAGSNLPVGEFYDRAYDMLMQRQYTEAASQAQQGMKLYNDNNYTKKFTILEASALAGSGNYDRAETIINDFLKNNPSDPLQSWAEAVMAYITSHRPAAPAPADPAANLVNGANHTLPPAAPGEQPGQPVDPTTGKPVPQPPAAGNINNTTPPAGTAVANNTNNGVPATYTYKPQEDHYVLFISDKTDEKTMGVKAAFTDIDNLRFSGQGLVSGIEVHQGGKGFVVTRGFHTAGQAKIYLNNVKNSPDIFREYKSNEYQLFIISAKNYLKLSADNDLQAYLNFYRQNYK